MSRSRAELRYLTDAELDEAIAKLPVEEESDEDRLLRNNTKPSDRPRHVKLAEQSDRAARKQALSDMESAWGGGDARGFVWQAPVGDSPAWIPDHRPLALDCFEREAPWINRQGTTARRELRQLATIRTWGTRWRAVADRLHLGLWRQAEHAEHLCRQVAGLESAPYRSDKSSDYEIHDFAGILEKLYGPDPRPEFAAFMAQCGIIPSKVEVGAGGSLRSFHVVGDAAESKNGWAILHRCPAAGSFGSWRTGEIYSWHSRREPDGYQFAKDYQIALVAHRARVDLKKAA